MPMDGFHCDELPNGLIVMSESSEPDLHVVNGGKSENATSFGSRTLKNVRLLRPSLQDPTVLFRPRAESPVPLEERRKPTLNDRQPGHAITPHCGSLSIARCVSRSAAARRQQAQQGKLIAAYFIGLQAAANLRPSAICSRFIYWATASR